MSDYVLRAKGIKKYFGGVKALDGVDLEIKSGEIHCLAGENGCGKSTLINVISGFYTPDAGKLEINGVEYDKMTPQKAIAAGVQVIYQDLSVFHNLTVMENLALNLELSAGKKFVNKKNMRKIAEEAISKINFDVDLDELVENLTVADKQLIAISRALLNSAKLIIMDEPTTAITKREVKALFKVIKSLQKQGISILFVSHKLDEVFEIAEGYTVFRGGKFISTGLASELTQQEFTYYMTGRNLSSEQFVYQESESAKTVLEVKNLSLKNAFSDINFNVKSGEIVGITGLLGCGRTEMVEAIFGRHRVDTGEIFVNGEKKDITCISDSIANGIGYVPPERLVEGVFLPQSIAENITIEKWSELSNRAGIINTTSLDKLAEEWVDKLSIKVGNIKDAMATLSGGNQQKCVLAKWLLLNLNVLILNGPTVGVDIGAKYDIYQMMRSLADEGIAILVISDDIPELLATCNRIMVMRRGRISNEFSTESLSEQDLATLAVAE